MKFKNLHPLIRWVYRDEKDVITPERLKQIQEVWGPISEGQLPWSIYGSALIGVGFVVFVHVFDLWQYFGLLFGLGCFVFCFCMWKQLQPHD